MGWKGGRNRLIETEYEVWRVNGPRENECVVSSPSMSQAEAVDTTARMNADVAANPSLAGTRYVTIKVTTTREVVE